MDGQCKPADYYVYALYNNEFCFNCKFQFPAVVVNYNPSGCLFITIPSYSYERDEGPVGLLLPLSFEIII